MTTTFAQKQSESITSLGLQVDIYEHNGTGAKHLHIQSEDDNNTFLVAFKTVPEDSSGVAHILEHTALCGSKKYPVRDPFFMMIRRSLNTFMNAMTSSDWTAYPFASQNKKDFANLLNIYLDAAFFPNLDELDFKQEGHRLEFSQADNADSELLYKGVVFNEMKGAMSSPVSTLWHRLGEALFPTTTYHHNSGGEPKNIPDLSWQQLKQFHQTHYHPSNAIFMTYGNIPAAEHQQEFENKVLHQFKKQAITFNINDEQRYSKPQMITDSYALSAADMADNKSHVVLGWLLGYTSDIEEMMAMQLLSDVLLGNSASPLRYMLETSTLGSAPSPINGLDDSRREMVFACGLEGAKQEDSEKITAQIIATLENVASVGVAQTHVESMLHQLEFSQREVGGDGYPYGLQLMFNALGPAIYDADPIAALAIDSVLISLQEKIKDKQYIANLIRKHLLQNQHRVTLTLVPDSQLAEVMEAEEKAKLASIRETLDNEQIALIIKQAAQLKARQEQEDDPNLLPKVGIADIKPDIKQHRADKSEVNKHPLTHYNQPTNGLSYVQVVQELPKLSEEQLALLPIYCDVVTELGSAGADYIQTQARQTAVCGGLSLGVSCRSGIDNIEDHQGIMLLSAKALNRNKAPMLDLINDTMANVRFDELDKISELIAEIRLASERGITGNGHGLAMMAASSGMSPVANINHLWRGLAAIREIKSIHDSLETPHILAALAEKLQAIHQLMIAVPKQFLVVSEAEQQAAIAEMIQQRWSETAATDSSRVTLPFSEKLVQQAWVTSTQVNFCAQSYKAVPTGHPDAPILSVLGGFLRNGYLHRKIREQGGAYGGGASYDGDAGAFRMFSYRDPRLTETFHDFSKALHWMTSNPHEENAVEEAILGVIGNMDKPSSPAGEASKDFYQNYHGRHVAYRRNFRNQVIAVDLKKLRAVAEKYLQAPCSQVVITNTSHLTDPIKEQMEIINI